MNSVEKLFKDIAERPIKINTGKIPKYAIVETGTEKTIFTYGDDFETLKKKLIKLDNDMIHVTEWNSYKELHVPALNLTYTIVETKDLPTILG